jgi:nucleotide-binding universal stress UspA family protein
MMEIHRILVPVDFSEHSQRALDEAIGLAKIFRAEVHLLHCYQPYPLGAAATSYDVVVPESYERAIREGANTQLTRWRDKARAQGVRVEKHISADLPSHGIVALAAELPADLIVIGTRGLTGFKHVLLGSVAERTVRLAPCPVMTVRPHD